MKKLLSTVIVFSMLLLPVMAGATIIPCVFPIIGNSTPIENASFYGHTGTTIDPVADLLDSSDFGDFVATFNHPGGMGDEVMIERIESYLGDISFDCLLKVEDGSTNGVLSLTGLEVTGNIVQRVEPYDAVYGEWDLEDGYMSQYTIVKAGDQFTLWDYGELVNGGHWNSYFLDCGSNMGYYEISHLTTLATNCAPVPEPATMLLFGTGLAGLVVVSKKKFKQK